MLRRLEWETLAALTCVRDWPQTPEILAAACSKRGYRVLMADGLSSMF